MSLFNFFKPSKRVRKIWWSVGATVLGTALLGGWTYWRDARRKTDLTDPRLSITAASQDNGPSDVPPIRFEDVAAEMGITVRHGPGRRGRLLTEDTGSGVAWGDYDNDGDWDLYVVNLPGTGMADVAGNRLYRNDGASFTDVTDLAGVADAESCGMGASFVDFDADGDQDLFVTNFGPNRLFENQGGGVYVDMAENAGVADPGWSTGATFGDFDRDGDIDFYVCNYVEYAGVSPSPDDIPTTDMGSSEVPFTLNPNSFDPAPNRLYRNQGDKTFVDVAVELGVANPRGRSLAATFCDLDGDGWLDLYVNNDVSANKLYRNPMFRVEFAETQEQRPFEDLSTLTGTADTRGSMGLSLGEIGQMDDAADGLPDLFITHWIAQENALYLSQSDVPGEILYLDKTRQFRLGAVSTNRVGWGSVLADFDLDGRDDIAVANGNTLEEKGDGRKLKPQLPFVFWNAGKYFWDVAPVAGPATAAAHSARGLAAADFDNDGDVDLALSVNRGSVLLLRNETKTENRSFKVRLNGAPAVCFGARIELAIGDTKQIRWWGSDVSFLSMHAQEMVFGIGTSDQVDRLTVRWVDGTETTRDDIADRQVVVSHSGATYILEPTRSSTPFSGGATAE
jgi:hypothetical protein